MSVGALWLKLRSLCFNSTDKGQHWVKIIINTHFMKLINKRVALFTAKLTSQPWLERKNKTELAGNEEIVTNMISRMKPTVWILPYPMAELSSSVAPRASKIRSPFGRRSPVKVLENPLGKAGGAQGSGGELCPRPPGPPGLYLSLPSSCRSSGPARQRRGRGCGGTDREGEGHSVRGETIP